MAETQDVDVLKRRGRRRLVGAIALVLLAVIVLPMVFDQQPKRSPAPISVRIPAPGESGSLLKTPPAVLGAAKPAPPVTEPPLPHQPTPAAASPPRVAPKPAPKSTPATAPAAAEAKAAKAEHARAVAALEDKQFVVPVAALAERSSVRRLTARLEAAKLPYFTEPIATAKGEVTRVRAGPFVSRAAADKAYAKLKRMGLKPGKAIPKS